MQLYLHEVHRDERLAERVATGDLRAWARELDGMQHGSTAKLLHHVPWSNQVLLRLVETGTPPELKQPGAFMHDALQVRDRWESRLLRASAWSPFW